MDYPDAHCNDRQHAHRRLLIDKGADVNRQNKFGQTALDLAIETGHPSFIRLLLKEGAGLDLDEKPLEIRLDWAAKYRGISKKQTDKIRNLWKAERELIEGPGGGVVGI